MEELYINNQKIELTDNLVSLTAQINDIAELKDRQSDYSNSIKILRTPKNVLIFEMIGVSGNKSRVPYKEVTVKYIVNGIEIISEGKGIVKNTNKYYNLVIYDGNISITDLLGDKQLNGLDFSVYNHDLTIENWIDSFSKTDGYIYGLGKFYENAKTSGIDIDLQNVSFYVHTLFDMIFTQKGYTLSGDFFNSVDYKSRVISMSTGHLRNSIDDINQVFQYDSSGDLVSNTYPDPTSDIIEVLNYTATATSVYKINLNGTFGRIHGDNFRFRIYINDISYESIIVPDGSFDIDISLQARVGDIIRLKLFAESVFELGANRIAFDPSFVTTIHSNEISIPIVIEDLIGETKQYDFVKEIMQHFGLIFRKTRNENNYEFIQLSQLLIDNENAEDWSGKYSNFINESYKSDYAQVNRIKYRYDNEGDETLTFADGEMLIDDVNLSTSKTLFTSILKASELDGQYNILNHWKDENENDEDVIVPVIEDLRMFKINVINDNILYRFNDSIINYSLLSDDVSLLDFQSIYYQNELDTHYAEVTQMLTDYKAITLELNLSVIDYYSRDFFKLKEIKQLGRYYYLNKISNFKKGKKTKVELIEITEIIKKIKEMIGTAFVGTSTFTATMGKLEFGSMIGSFAGKSTFTGSMTKTTFTSFLLSNGTIEENACGETAINTKYHNGAFAFVSIGNTVFDDDGGLTPFNGSFMWYKTAFNDIVEINTNGIVIDKINC